MLHREHNDNFHKQKTKTNVSNTTDDELRRRSARGGTPREGPPPPHPPPLRLVKIPVLRLRSTDRRPSGRRPRRCWSIVTLVGGSGELLVVAAACVRWSLKQHGFSWSTAMPRPVLLVLNGTTCPLLAAFSRGPVGLISVTIPIS